MKKRFIVRDCCETDYIYGLLVCECDSEEAAQKAIEEAKSFLKDEEWQIGDIIEYLPRSKAGIKKVYFFDEFDGSLYV